MIRAKRPEADLKRPYRRLLSRSLGLSAVLHLGLFSIDPAVEIEPAPMRREVVVIELEAVPETRQPIPPLLRQPEAAVSAPTDTLPRLPVDLDPPEVITEFAPESDEEVAEFWMVEKRPRVLKRVLPEYPAVAREALIEGKVSVRLLLDRQGRVLRVGRVTGPAVFRPAAAEAARQWEFTPAIQNDQAVRVWVSLPFTFQLEDGGDPGRSNPE